MKITKIIISSLLVMCMSLFVVTSQLKTDVYATSNATVQENVKVFINTIKEKGEYEEHFYVYTMQTGTIAYYVAYAPEENLACFTLLSASLKLKFYYDLTTCEVYEAPLYHYEHDDGNITEITATDFSTKDYYKNKNLSFKISKATYPTDDIDWATEEASYDKLFNDSMSLWEHLLSELNTSFEKIGFLNYYGDDSTAGNVGDDNSNGNVDNDSSAGNVGTGDSTATPLLTLLLLTSVTISAGCFLVKKKN